MEKSKLVEETSRSTVETEAGTKAWSEAGAEAESGLEGLESISNSILSTRNMNNITGQLSNIGQMALLPEGPRRRGTEQNVHQRLVVREEGEFLSYQEKTKMMHGRISSQQLPVKGGVFGLGGGEFLEEESHQGPETTDLLL